MQNLVIVESPAKAKTIEKYLGANFTVLSSVGHIRKDTAIDPANKFAVTYEISPDHKKVVSELKKAAAAASHIWLATDEDREGEAISWHLLEVLKLPKDTARITFHEITKSALEAAIKNPRTVDMPMVESQQTRQSLDMLVGYDLSGVVRKKVPGAISAGRVQSPALRLVVEREREIEKFAASSSYKITGFFAHGSDQLPATLDTSFKDEPSAREYLESIATAQFAVADVTKSPATKSAPAPFTTATLQIEANQKLGFSPKTTMSAAQGLYQAGLITYHRTDSLNLSGQAIASMADFITNAYGPQYHQARKFSTKSASAQEAHEAIRPTHVEAAKAGKNNYEQKLYNLIRSRTLATQMSNAKLEKSVVIITTPNSQPVFEAKGEVILFDGFLRVYGSSKETTLPKLSVGDALKTDEVTARQTFSRPPARYTEGSLVKKLESLGIGRPSTYAGILGAVQDRGYIAKGESEGTNRDIIEIKLSGGTIQRDTVTEKTASDKGKLLPTPIGELLSDFLSQHFTEIVDYDFTANIETALDQIAEGKLRRVKMLTDFYGPFSKLVADSEGATRFNNARELGLDPATGQMIYAKVSRNGEFLQRGENEKESGQKPTFAPIPAGKTIKTISLDDAIKQFSLPQLPRSLGQAADGVELIAANGPFGPYLKAGQYNIPMKNHDPYTVTLAEATEAYEAKKASVIADWGDVQIINGAYGPYVKGPGRFNNAKVPKTTDPKTITEAEAREMLATNGKSGKTSKFTRSKKSATKKPARKSTKKTTTRKTSKSTKK
jgi:DNA topoisomerase-1